MGVLQPDEEAEDAEHRNILDIEVRRAQLEKWQNEPFFERSLPGAVVRIAMGRMYFMAQLVHIEERDPGTYKWVAPSKHSHRCACDTSKAP